MNSGTTNVDQSANLTVMSYYARVDEKGKFTTEEVDHGKGPDIDPKKLKQVLNKNGLTINLSGNWEDKMPKPGKDEKDIRRKARRTEETR